MTANRATTEAGQKDAMAAPKENASGAAKPQNPGDKASAPKAQAGPAQAAPAKQNAGPQPTQPKAQQQAAPKPQKAPAQKADPAKKGGSVIPLPVKGAPSPQKAVKFFSLAGLRPQQKRRRVLWASFLLCVLIPAILGSVYFAFIASDRYVSKAGFSVRSIDGPAMSGDFLGAITGVASQGSTTTDSYMILEYLKSREMVERLNKDMSLKEKFADDNVDFFYRIDPALPIESFVSYWDWMISASFDTSSSIINFEVEAFTPEDAQQAGELVLQYASQLVNELSDQARRDTVRFAEQEVSRAELRLRMIRKRMKEFRETENAIDPSLNAEVQIQLIARLQERLSDTRARLATLEGTIDESSPTIRQLRREEAAIEKQIAEKQSEIGGRPGAAKPRNEADGRLSPLSSLLADYEELKLESEFAQQAYVTALASLEQSRAEADRRQRYLAVFERPSYPEEAIYPRRVTNSILLFLGLLIVWAIGTLIVYSVRDHLR